VRLWRSPLPDATAPGTGPAPAPVAEVGEEAGSRKRKAAGAPEEEASLEVGNGLGPEARQGTGAEEKASKEGPQPGEQAQTDGGPSPTLREAEAESFKENVPTGPSRALGGTAGGEGSSAGAGASTSTSAGAVGGAGGAAQAQTGLGAACSQGLTAAKPGERYSPSSCREGWR